jgi:hypothetical protein
MAARDLLIDVLCDFVAHGRPGQPFDVRLPEGLRAIYPLTRLDTSEVL